MKKLNLLRNSGLSILLILMSSLCSVKTYSQCQAGFTWAQTSNNVITFTNTSTGVNGNTQYTWDMGNGDYNFFQNPVYTYNIPGTYLVCLTISDSLSCQSYFCDSITVTGVYICNLTDTAIINSLPSCGICADGGASAYYSGGTSPYAYMWSNGETTQYVTDLLPGTYTVCVTDVNNCTACATITLYTCSLNASFTWAQTSNNVITFTNTSTNNMIYNTSYQWDYGDGNYDYIENPVHTYDVPGTYYVCLQISLDTISNSCISTWCDSVTVTGVLICNLADTTFENFGATCGTCPNGSATTYPMGGTAPFIYLWSNGETTQTVTDLLPGTYSVCVSDVNNCSACSSVTIDSCSLQAGFTWSQTANNTITFTNTSTGITFYYDEWDFGDGNFDYSQNPVHFFSMPGTYYVCLHLTDSNFVQSCSSDFCDSVTVTGYPCNIVITDSVTNSSCNICADGSITTTVTGGTPPYIYSWTGNISTGPSAYNLVPGGYDVCVTDSNGCMACLYITVSDTSNNNTGCSANFTIYPDSTQLHTYWAINYATGVQPLTYDWSWGDSTFSTGPYPSHTYDSAGYYTICLTITDSVGCQSTYCDTSLYLQSAHPHGNSSDKSITNTMIYINVIAPTTGIPSIQNLSNWSVFPNPVSNSMNINYNISSASKVLINVYDMLGNKIKEIANDNESSGQHSIIWNATTIPQGIYLLQIIADNKILNQKITVMK